MNKKYLIILVWAFTFPMALFSQNFRVNPPSDKSISLGEIDEVPINTYRGIHGLSIPLYIIKTPFASVPITLDYVGGQGIKVAEHASWVGLGWKLNAGGIINRTIIGFPDDSPNGTGGYWGSSGIATTDLLRGIAENRIDCGPDLFQYNFINKQGQFYIDRDAETIVQKPLNNIIIEPILNTLPYIYQLHEFKITDESGTIYSFGENWNSERVHSSNIGYFTSGTVCRSWYLTSIKNHNENNEITFNYVRDGNLYNKTYRKIQYTPEPYEMGNNPYVYNERVKDDNAMNKVLETIIFTNGSIEFIIGEHERKDIIGTYLKKILVKNNTGTTIKEFIFYYSYFDSFGTLPIGNSNLTGDYGDIDLRLKLDSLVETGKPAFIFKYNEGHYLPDRRSYATDHWGYYNGQNNNSSPIPDHVYELEISGQVRDFKKGAGTNKTPVEEFLKAEILEEVIFPTGGKTTFEYEINKAKIENSIFMRDYLPQEEKNIWDNTIGNPTTITIASSSYSKIEVNDDQGGPVKKLTGKEEVNDDPCDKIITFSNSEISKNVFTEHYFGGTNPDYEYAYTLLPTGTYNVQWRYRFNDGVCNENIELNITWQNEHISDKKNAAGLRIKSVTNKTSDNKIANKKTYTYTNNDGKTTGRILEIPIYAYERLYFWEKWDYFNGSVSWVISPEIMLRWELLFKNYSNHIGYKKVTVKQKGLNSTNGKTEYFFTTPEEYPNLAGSLYAYNNRIDMFEYFEYQENNNIYAPLFPPSQSDEHNTMRGILLKQIDYKETDAGYDTIRKIEYDYHFWTEDAQQKLTSQDSVMTVTVYIDTANIVREKQNQKKTWSFKPIASKSNNSKENIVFPYNYVYGWAPRVNSWIWVNDHIHNTTYIESINWSFITNVLVADKYLSKDIKLTNFYNNGEITPETTIYNYDLYNGNEEDVLYHPIKISKTNSDGTVTYQNFVYPRDYELLTGLTSNEQTAYEELFTRNVYTPIETSIEKDSRLIEKNRTNYNIFSEGLFSKSEEKAFGTEQLKEELFYDKYDEKGNVLQFHKANGIKTTILYGYGYAYPIAKIESKTYTEVIAGLSVTYEDLQTKTSSELKTIFNALRNNESMKDAMITGYTYDPLIGMTSQTNANGTTTIYKYDNFGRLETIRDQDGKVVKQMEYRYKNETAK